MESENQALARQVMASTSFEELLVKINAMEEEKSSLLNRFQEVESENKDYKERYNEIEEEMKHRSWLSIRIARFWGVSVFPNGKSLRLCVQSSPGSFETR